MDLDDAIDLLGSVVLDARGPSTWADLGCGDGIFTRALAARLAAGSTIHAMDRDRAALTQIPAEHDGVYITTHRGDFTRRPWPFADLDGVLMANSLHYVQDQTGFIRACVSSLRPGAAFLIVEYDIDGANRWVPYPVSRLQLDRVFRVAGYLHVETLASRPSLYHRGGMYAALVTR